MWGERGERDSDGGKWGAQCRDVVNKPTNKGRAQREQQGHKNKNIELRKENEGFNEECKDGVREGD